MTTFPPRPDARFPKVIADHGKQVTRAHARLDQVESTQSQQAGQIATNTTNITSNTTAITAVNTGSGGTSHENFLGSISKASHVTQTDGGGWTSGGSIVGSTQIDTSVLTGWMNEVNADIANIISALRAANLMS